MSRYTDVMAKIVLPDPVAIWTSERGWLRLSDQSTLPTASTWTG